MDLKLSVYLVCTVLVGCTVPFDQAPLYNPLDSAQIAADFAPAASTTATSPTVGPNQPIDWQRSVLTLSQCIAIAIHKHLDIRMADRRVAMAEDLLAEGWTPQIPRLSVRGQYEVRDNDQVASFFGQDITLAEQDAGSVSGAIDWLIYDFGRAGYQRDAIRGQISTAKLNAQHRRHDLALAVGNTYLSVLEAQKWEKIVAQSLQILQEQRQITQDFLGQGLAQRSDFLAVEVQIAERQQELIRVQNNTKAMTATLARYMGIAVDTPLQIAEITVNAFPRPDWTTALRSAIAQRPDLLALRDQVTARQAEYRSLLANLTPSISAYGRGFYSSENGLGNKKGLAAGVSMEWNLFDGGATYQRLHLKEKEIAEARDLYASKVDDIALEVKKLCLKVEETSARIGVAQKGMVLAEENLRLYRDQYGQGLVTSTDVLREDDRLARVKIQYYQAVYDFCRVFAALSHAMGMDLEMQIQKYTDGKR